MDSDFLLIQKMKLGDDAAVEAFVRKYYSKIFQYCQLHIRDYGYAEDFTQETFEKFFRSLKQYHHYQKAINYLYVIAANICKDYYKKKPVYYLEDVKEQQVVDRNMNMGRIDNKILVELAFHQLPEELKEVAILFFFQELRQKEIARILGIGLPLVKYRIRRSRTLLAEYLGKDE